MTCRPSQGEALLTWLVWGVIATCVVVTYSRLDPSETYHVSREGIAGGLSRALTFVNFPIALVAIALALVAVAALPARAWWAAVPAVVLCATIPLFNDQANLDAHAGNAIPAVGVAIAGCLTVAATLRAGSSLAPRRPWDPARVVVAALLAVVSLPWISAELGFHFPGDVFMGEEVGREGGEAIAAVHLGHHHGLDGAMLVLTGLVLSRVVVPGRRLRIALQCYLGLMLAYGAVNCFQDGWNEQLHKRGMDGNVDPVGASTLADADLARRRRTRRPCHSCASPGGGARVILRHMTPARMVFLGFGKYARADKIYALEPITGDDRGGGRRTRVWIEGVSEPLVASRTERTILHDMGHEAGDTALLDGALDLAERLAAAAEEGRVDLGDLGRRARKLLASTARPAETEPLF